MLINQYFLILLEVKSNIFFLGKLSTIVPIRESSRNHNFVHKHLDMTKLREICNRFSPNFEANNEFNEI